MNDIGHYGIGHCPCSRSAPGISDGRLGIAGCRPTGVRSHGVHGQTDPINIVVLYGYRCYVLLLQQSALTFANVVQILRRQRMAACRRGATGYGAAASVPTHGRMELWALACRVIGWRILWTRPVNSRSTHKKRNRGNHFPILQGA